MFVKPLMSSYSFVFIKRNTINFKLTLIDHQFETFICLMLSLGAEKKAKQAEKKRKKIYL